MRHGRLGILVVVLAAGTVAAQPSTPPANQPDQPPRVPSLDELLGLGPSEGDGANRAALDRKLSAQEAGEQFRQAVDLMGDAAQRLAGRDTGLQTQRIQEEIIRKLDQIIEAARENQSGGSSSSSSSSQSSSQQQQPSQSTQRQQSGQPANSGDNEHTGPELSGVEMNPGVAPDGVTWGNLPQRDREAVTQGVNDRYSALYRRLTELYYRRLAEREEDR